MTLSMVLALSVLVIMIGLIMFDVLPFGAPPLVACLLLVVFGLSTVPEAFAGFVNSSVLMIAFFMVPLAALQKTKLIGRVKATMAGLVEKGGYKSYILLLVVVMLGASLAGTGSTGYYVLILALVSTIPYDKKLPTSKLMMPLGFATNHPLVPVNVALLYGVMVTVLEASGFREGVSMVTFALVNFVMGMAYLAWALVAYRLLPDHPIAEPAVDTSGLPEGEEYPEWKEYLTIAAFVVSVVAMMMMNVLGDLAYVVPGLAAFVLLFIKMVDFKEFRENLFAPVILMMAGVIGVADALAKSGFTALVGDAVAGWVGASVPPFLLVLVFALLTSAAATLTGSNMGSVMIFAPIAIATCTSLGLSPVAAAAAVAIAGWQGGFMPIDGMPALIYGMGKYRLLDFWKFTVPMYFIRIFALSGAAVLLFPM